jgi:CelD/BcsL family acetyltransferase involved in cellulose biosynthesis
MRDVAWGMTAGAAAEAARPSEATGRLSVRVAHGPEAADLFDSAWDDLVLRQRVPNPTLCTPWMRHYLQLERATPYAVTVSDGPTLVAAGAFAVREPLGRHGPRIARWLGPGRLLNQPDVLGDAGASRTAPARVLMETVLEDVHGVHLGKAPLDGSAVRSLRAVAPWTHEERAEDGWLVVLPPKRHARLVQKTRYAERKVERLGGRVRVEVWRRPTDVVPALERLYLLYLERWRERGGELGRFASPASQRSWYRSVIAEAAERGTVRLVEVFENDILVSSLLGLLAGRGALFHTTATRPGGKLWGPGHRAMLAWAEEAERSGATRMDLGRGSAEPGSPKARLGPTPIPFGKVIAASSRRWQGSVVAACRSAAFLRDAAGSVLPRERFAARPRSAAGLALDERRDRGDRVESRG